MKKLIIFLVLLSFSLNAYSFWIWSPKTQKWKNPKYSPLATPQSQLEEGLKLFDDTLYKEALVAFRKVVLHYPDAKEAAEAQYYMGRCYEELQKQYRAFLEYQKVIDTYPNSQRIVEIVEREYAIGEYFLNREVKKWLGVSIYDVVEHPSIEIFKRVADSAPYSEVAIKARYKLGVLFKELSRYEEAREAFQELVDNYPENEWAEAGKYQLALVSVEASLAADYDQTTTQDAIDKLEEFVKEHPEARVSDEAFDQIGILREREAKKNFDIAAFYERQRQYKSAEVYYTIVARDYPESSWAIAAQTRLEALKEMP